MATSLTALLDDMMHNEVEVYVDDVIVKSKDREGYIVNLKKFFESTKMYLWSNYQEIIRLFGE